MFNKKYIVLLLAIVATISLLLSDIFLRSISFFDEGNPIFNIRYFVRTFLIIITSGFWTLSIIFWGSSKKNNIVHDALSKKAQKWILAIVLLIEMFFLASFQISPQFFNYLVLEDHFIETCSALFYFLSFGLLVFIYKRINRAPLDRLRFYKIGIMLLALFFLFIGLEEVSWFQRVFEIESPEMFDKNEQRELNLHNFATNLSENILYFFGFAFLILLPFIIDKVFHNRNGKIVSFFTPSRFIIFVSAMSMAYNHDMWNIIITQFCFFITLFILVSSVRSDDPGEYMFLVRILISVYVLTQIIYLINSDLYIRDFDVTEYKEFLISMSFFIYSIELLAKTKKLLLNRIVVSR